ncbi:MAG: type III polyketide synthase [Planctomycetes bacterium]|nr:type III polyketide synthase [Planctomycetota bacterium]
MSMRLLGFGTATPARRILQQDAAALASAFTQGEPGHDRTVAAIYRQTRIRSRGSVLLEDPGAAAWAQSFFPPASTTEPDGPSTRARMDRYAMEAGPLAILAAGRALTAAGVDADAITHLVTCSCTGFANPGVDLDLLTALGLSPSTARTHVGFMGCHGAFNALRVAEAFVAARPDSVPLVVCVELCSLHFQYGPRSDVIVANSIFADGAAAVVGGQASRPQRAGGPTWALDRQWSRILPDSRDEMGWLIGDHGFEMSLSATVPGTIGRHLPEAVADGLAAAGLAVADVGSWVVHPGGPRVLTTVQDALGLSAESLAASHAVLTEHGNMSSATILFILERLVRGGSAGPCVAMAFGPGLTAEFALLRRT